MLLDLPDPDLSLFERIRIHLSSVKNSKTKPWFLPFYWLLYDLFYLKNDVNVPPSKSNKQKTWWKQIYFLLASWRVLTRAGSGHGPRCHDPQHWLLWKKQANNKQLFSQAVPFISNKTCRIKSDVLNFFLMFDRSVRKDVIILGMGSLQNLSRAGQSARGGLSQGYSSLGLVSAITFSYP